MLTLCCILMALGLAGAVLIKRARENARETGVISVRVYDAITGEALSGATVVLPAFGQSARTGRNGSTGEILLTVEREARYDAFHAASWGEITLLVYRTGYYPCALFHVQLGAGEKRDGPHVYLLEDDGTLDAPYSLIESPPPGWVSALLDKFAP